MLQTSCFVARSVQELKDGITTGVPFHPALALIFSSVKLGLPDLVQTIATIGIPVFGCSSAGEILVPSQSPPVYEQSAVCCLLDLPPSLFSLRLFDRKNEPGREFGQRIGRWGMEQFSKPAFILSIANLENNGEAIIRGIEAACPGGTVIYGGFAGDNSVPKKTSVFSSTGHSYDGAVVLVIDRSKVAVKGITSSGWTGVGAEMVITSSEGSFVYTINGRPALDVMLEYLNVSEKDLLPVAINFPLLLKRPDTTELLRTITAVDADKRSLKFAGNVPQGSKVRFSSSFGDETVETAIRDIKNYHPDHAEADLLLLFSCLARHRSVGPSVNREITAIYDLWKCPLVGLFCCGEIGPNRYGTCELYNNSLSLVQIHVVSDPS